MTINSAFIGFGKSATRYHLPYVFQRRDTFRVKTIFDVTRRPALEAEREYQGIHFTDSLNDILLDESIRLVTLCTPPETHYNFARQCLEHGKNVIVEKPFTRTLAEAQALFALAAEKGLTVTPFQNRRFDSCFLAAKKVIDSGVLGKIVEFESHFDYFRPDAPDAPGDFTDGAFYGLGVHLIDQVVSLFGRPEFVHYDIRSVRNKNNPDDTFELQLYYGDIKAIVKCSHLVMQPYPKFIVNGENGSFIKLNIDQQETCLKAGIMPGSPHFGQESEFGLLKYQNQRGEIITEKVNAGTGDYGRVYDAVYATLVHRKPPYISQQDVMTTMEILHRAFEQPAPALIKLR
ncbi:oxidoreductase [Rahnella sp. Lac-M11]|uniref:Oxidoreductase n=1 Tax=Rahnella contaminans TaxID=2703882 RepID=A0A6M2B9V3_9GAMM|nr:oxidoreductase [Rahnella contaminans]NGX89027.1 oxidoreductase [Rahnella contaminans]